MPPLVDIPTLVPRQLPQIRLSDTESDDDSTSDGSIPPLIFRDDSSLDDEFPDDDTIESHNIDSAGRVYDME
jgi:hypothetical protein